MPKKRVDAVVGYPDQPMVVTSVATTNTLIVLSIGDGRKEHYTYPPDGRFHITPEDGGSESSLLRAGPRR